MKRLAITAVAIALLTSASVTQAQAPPLPPGEPPNSGPPPGLPALPQEPQAPPGVVPPASAETLAPPSAYDAPRAAGKVESIRLKGRTLIVRIACTAEARARLQLRSEKISIGQRRYKCSGSRTFKLRASRTVVRRAHRKTGVDVHARISARGFESSALRVRLRAGSTARASAVARASANRILCSWCATLTFGNQESLEYWVRAPESWFEWNGWTLWWGDAQYYQAFGYMTTYRYWYHWSSAGWVNYATENIGP